MEQRIDLMRSDVVLRIETLYAEREDALKAAALVVRELGKAETATGRDLRTVLKTAIEGHFAPQIAVLEDRLRVLDEIITPRL